MLYVLLEEIRCIKETVIFSMALGDLDYEGTETGMVTGAKKERAPHKLDFSDHIR